MYRIGLFNGGHKFVHFLYIMVLVVEVGGCQPELLLCLLASTQSHSEQTVKHYLKQSHSQAPFQLFNVARRKRKGLASKIMTSWVTYCVER